MNCLLSYFRYVKSHGIKMPKEGISCFVGSCYLVLTVDGINSYLSVCKGVPEARLENTSDKKTLFFVFRVLLFVQKSKRIVRRLFQNFI